MLVSTDLHLRLAELTDRLTNPATETFDLDGMAALCRELSLALQNSARLEQGYRLLRDDFEGRLAGMLRAIAVAARSQGELSEVELEMVALASLGDDELLTRSKRIAARFRDTFPGVLLPNRPMTSGGRGMHHHQA